MLRNLNIRNKLIWIIFIVTFFSLILGTLFFTISSIRTYRQDLVESVKANARLTSRIVLSPMLFKDPEGVRNILDELQSIGYIHYAQVFDKDGQPGEVYNPRNMQIDEGPAEKENYWWGEGYLFVKEPILYKDEMFGTILLAASTAPIKSKINQLLISMIITLLIIFIIAFFIAGWLQRLISRPILDLVNATNRITHEENLEVRVEKTTEDETGQLVDSFNEMLERLDTRSKQRDAAYLALRENEEKLTKITESAFDAIILVNADHQIISWNKAAERIFGYSKKDVEALNFLDLFVSPEDISATVSQKLRDEDYLDNYIELPAQNKDKRTFPAELSLATTLFQGKKHYVATLRDISQRKKNEMELIQAKEKAEESDKLKSAFLANMSHEIRTPLNAIIGFSELLANPKLYSKKKDKYLDYITKSGKNLLNLINDIIDISKIEAGQLKIKKVEVDIISLLHDTYQFFENNPRISEKPKLELKLTLPAEMEHLHIYTDAYRVQQVLNNLLSNAAKFTEEGFIEIGLKAYDEILEFYVQDTGLGIPKDKQDLVFDRFGQVQDHLTKNQGGTGLGLSISRKLIELLGGRMGVMSNINEGSTFYFTLPFQKVLKATTKEKGKTDDMANYEWNNKTILIAEDEDINFMFLQEALRVTQANILWARNGEDAINQALDNEDIDLVLMDIKMPVKDGYEATKIIKKERPALPIIAQTAYAMSGEQEKSQAAGCDNFVAKPIKPAELLSIITQYL